ncbi:Uncharacterised protein [Amycolatopsis camponoti]|uniref:Uncharacterized protein n=1 Tax=Amycolatopsis camponoti TaxID=2606593 RepID=A0A6I8LDR2_9PSEU|nr:Uncharacterised protein [Amycolatopsis camponoti]
MVRLRHRVEARWQAARDSRSGALLTLEQSGGITVASTRYVWSLHAEADRASNEALVRLHTDNEPLIVEIRNRAWAVIRAEELGATKSVHHRRLGHSLAEWETVASCAAHDVGAVVSGLNRIIDRYWARLATAHRALRSDGPAASTSPLQPRRIVRDDRWSRPLDLLPHRCSPNPAVPAAVIDRAVEIVVFGATA